MAMKGVRKVKAKEANIDKVHSNQTQNKAAGKMPRRLITPLCKKRKISYISN
jgi:hypothetical protein